MTLNRMGAIFLSTFLVLGLASCAHRPTSPVTSEHLFAYGTYKHQVQVDVITPPRKMEMRGVVAYTPTQLKVVGLSPFGTTLFRIEENLTTGEVKKEFYMDAIQKHETQFLQFYSMIRAMVTGPSQRTEFTQDGADFVVSEPDVRGVYRKINVKHSRFNLEVRVTDYEI